jgi:protein-ribulosamine 3-kinase
MDPANPAPSFPEHDGLHSVALAGIGRAILKRRRDAPAGFFAAEVRGLEALRSTGAMRVPKVIESGDDFLLLEDLGEGRADDHFHAVAGAALARLHAVHGRMFGFDADGWCGDTPQSNAVDPDGWRFFADARLRAQMRLAYDHERIDRGECDVIESICTRLPHLVPEQPASLIHGDLWTGNLHCCGNGEPALIDAAAVHYGWAEADLAMLTLFGSPPPVFFDSYAEHGPLQRDWRERAPLYNLYHLLNHLNLFGEGYRAPLQRALARFR